MTIHVVDRIIAYEEGTLPPRDTLELFGELVRSGMVWSLQGSYGRTAQDLITYGYLTKEGHVTVKGLEQTQDLSPGEVMPT
jgi:hypothetical protein